MSDLIYIPVSDLYPHPDNPRTELGDLTELADSIKAKGILQNLTVIPGHYVSEETWKTVPEAERLSTVGELSNLKGRYLAAGGYTVIIGHRRLAAAKSIKLDTVPCVIAEMTPQEQVQTMLLENMQRRDLKIYEQAQGFQLLLDFGSSVDEISAKTGFSATTIRRRVKMNELNQKKLKEVVDTRLISLADFDELAKIKDVKDRNEALDKIGTENFSYTVKGILRKQVVQLYLPEVLSALKTINAQEIKAADTYDGKKYKLQGDIKIENWDEEKRQLSQLPAQPLYYVLNTNWGEISLYTKNKRAKAAARSASELEREHQIAEKWKYLMEQSTILYNLRKDYIENYVVTAKNKTNVLYGAVLAASLHAASYNPPDRQNLLAVLGLTGNYYSADMGLKVITALASADSKDYAKLIWYLYGDTPEQSLVTGYGKKKTYPEYQAVPRLLALYDWLKRLGYKLSTAEETLIYGTDAVYQHEEADKSSVA